MSELKSGYIAKIQIEHHFPINVDDGMQEDLLSRVISK
jgi:hypothetical protein